MRADPGMIGIFGGTFDPIHYGHLRPALEVKEALGLTEVRFIPLGVAPHRSTPHASPAQRLALVAAAIRDQAGFVLDDRELHRQGPSYSYDTLRSLRSELGPQRPLCLLLGADAFAELPSWHRPEGILELAHLVVMARPGAQPPGDLCLQRWIGERATSRPALLKARSGGQIYFQGVTQLAIAATAIRSAIAAGQSPRYLLPDPVLALIEQERLYRDQVP